VSIYSSWLIYTQGGPASTQLCVCVIVSRYWCQMIYAHCLCTFTLILYTCLIFCVCLVVSRYRCQRIHVECVCTFTLGVWTYPIFYVCLVVSRYRCQMIYTQCMPSVHIHTSYLYIHYILCLCPYPIFSVCLVVNSYGVVTISRLLTMVGLFCRISSVL